MCCQLENMIDEVVARGTPPGRCFLGGFSNGGAAALHAGMMSNHRLGGIFCLSGALSSTSALPSQVRRRVEDLADLPPVLMCHGKEDPVLPVSTGKRTADALAKAGAALEWEAYGRLRHGLGDGEIRRVAGWVNALLDDHKTSAEAAATPEPPPGEPAHERQA